ncbi:hypothetical protein OG301_36980 [Streptomyces platensis]|uniref:hypothetical protein n=1 Tax=Streptomyces platensis TaxID=58346 RepID=UPI002E262535|nr:hypothetical protein OG301_36980 [Streptomyces platensis]WUB78027.1 hypothetical protein OG424_01800 [Streptomyces platensis]
MIIDDAQPQIHATWWKTPLVASLPGLPALVWEYMTFRADGYTSGIEMAVVIAMVLLAGSWILPHRRSVRGLRMAAAGTALGLAMLPLLYAILLGAAMASG